jgi:hypothetical protein
LTLISPKNVGKILLHLNKKRFEVRGKKDISKNRPYVLLPFEPVGYIRAE